MTQAGWYADPADLLSERYWDGDGWTELVRPASSGAPGVATPPDPPAAPPVAPPVAPPTIAPPSVAAPPAVAPVPVDPAAFAPAPAPPPTSMPTPASTPFMPPPPDSPPTAAPAPPPPDPSSVPGPTFTPPSFAPPPAAHPDTPVAPIAALPGFVPQYVPPAPTPPPGPPAGAGAPPSAAAGTPWSSPTRTIVDQAQVGKRSKSKKAGSNTGNSIGRTLVLIVTSLVLLGGVGAGLVWFVDRGGLSGGDGPLTINRADPMPLDEVIGLFADQGISCEAETDSPLDYAMINAATELVTELAGDDEKDLAQPVIDRLRALDEDKSYIPYSCAGSNLYVSGDEVHLAMLNGMAPADVERFEKADLNLVYYRPARLADVKAAFDAEGLACVPDRTGTRDEMAADVSARVALVQAAPDRDSKEVRRLESLRNDVGKLPSTVTVTRLRCGEAQVYAIRGSTMIVDIGALIVPSRLTLLELGSVVVR